MMTLPMGLGATAWETNLLNRWGAIWSTAYANFYEKYHYGDIPMPGAGLPAPPPPPAPQTEEELHSWTPERMEAPYGPAWEEGTVAQGQVIAGAEQSGVYTPEGQFPGTYSDWAAAKKALEDTLGGVSWYVWAGGALVLWLWLGRR